MYREYYLRSAPALWPTLLQLGKQLGALTLTYTEFLESEDENGFPVRTPVGEPIVSAVDGSWSYIGQIMQPTGATEAVGDFTVPVMAPIANAEGVAYLHANLRTKINLREVAEAMAAENPDLAVALSSISNFFVVDLAGNPVAPNQPHRVWL